MRNVALKSVLTPNFFPIILLRGIPTYYSFIRDMSPAHSMEQQCMVITEERWDVGKDKKKERGTKNLEALVGFKLNYYVLSTR